MVTTIQISENLQSELQGRKLFDRESYEEVILDLLEDAKQLSKETLKDIKEAEADIKAGRLVSWENLKMELKLNV